MEKPFTLLLMPLILGILFANFFHVNTKFLLISIVLILLYLLYNTIKGKLNQRILYLMIFALGIYLTLSVDNSYLETIIGESHEYYGIVEEVIKEGEDKSSYILSVKAVDSVKIYKEKLVLTLIGSGEIDIGDRVIFDGELKLPKENTNPKLYNYKLSLKSQKIATTSTIKDYNIIKLDKGQVSYRHLVKRNIIKDVDGLFRKYLGDKNANLMSGMILGKSYLLDEESLDLYRDMGLAHILAVSGLHIGIISSFIFFILSRMGIKRNINTFMTLSFIWFYGFIIGFPTSILRANIMLTVVFYSRLIHEPYDSTNSLSFAALMLLLINPYYLFNLGFQLSFIATLSLLVLRPKLVNIFYPWENKLTSTLAMLLAVNLGLFPIQAYYFNSISLLTIAANILIVPLLSFSLVLGLVMVMSLYTFNFFNAFIGPLLKFLLYFQFKILSIFEMIPFNKLKIFSPNLGTIALFYIFLMIAFKVFDISRLRLDLLNMWLKISSLILLINFFSFYGQDFLELHFIDVGQGDSILIRTERANYLMDTGGSLLGNYDIGKNITLPYLEKLGVFHLDAIFISHFHEDHSQGLGAILEEIDVGHIFSSYYPKEEYQRMIRGKDIDFTVLKKGAGLKMDKDLSMDVIWPNHESTMAENENNMSLVSILRFGEVSVLFTGDLEKEGEHALSKDIPKVDILKVAHHGSNTSSTQEFIDASKAKYAVISVGRNNMYQHPSEDVVARYKDLGADLYRTDLGGLVLAKIKNNKIRFETFLENGVRRKVDIGVFIVKYLGTIFSYFLFLIFSYVFTRMSTKGE